MVGRVGEDVVTGRKTTSAKEQHPVGRFLEVFNHNVEVHLLGVVGIRPARLSMVNGKLKRQPRRLVVVGDHHPVMRLIGHGEHEQFGIEPCQGEWGQSMTTWCWRPITWPLLRSPPDPAEQRDVFRDGVERVAIDVRAVCLQASRARTPRSGPAPGRADCPGRRRSSRRAGQPWV